MIWSWPLVVICVPVIVVAAIFASTAFAIPVAIVFGILVLVPLSFAIEGTKDFIEVKNRRAKWLLPRKGVFPNS